MIEVKHKVDNFVSKFKKIILEKPYCILKADAGSLKIISSL